MTHGEIHPNPGPTSLFKFMHWNLNSIPAHEFQRIAILENFAFQENLNLIDLTETALKNSHTNEKIEIQNYSFIRNDLSNNDRCGGVILYHENDLPVKNRIDLQIPNTIVTEISISKNFLHHLL